jgi:uncharacterized protein
VNTAAPARPAGALARLSLALFAFFVACVAALAWPLDARSDEVLPVPPLSARVIDETGTLGASSRGALDAKLEAFEAESGTQIVVLLVATTAPEDIAAYAQRVADTWKIGRREVGDGLLVVVAVRDRRIRIEVAKALEGAVPDVAAYRIIDETLRPAFRAGDYAGGLDRAVDRLIALVRGERLPAPADRRGDAPASGTQGIDLLTFFFFAVPVAGLVLTRLLGRRLGSLATALGTGALAWLVTASLLIGLGAAVAALVLVGLFGIGALAPRGWRGPRGPYIGGGWGGFGGGGFGRGGGFSSGGGGDFGGGGASGNW